MMVVGARVARSRRPPRIVMPDLQGFCRRLRCDFPRMLGIAGAALIAGCASMAPSFETPPLPVPARYAADTAQEGADAAGIAWHDYFADPHLRRLITRALDNNRDLRIAVLRVDESRAAYGTRRSEQFPTLGAQASLDRSRVPADLNLTRQPLLASQYQVGLGMASWEIDFWGRVRSLQDAALETFLGTDAARRAAILVLVAQVANGFLSLCELDERIALARQTLASRAETPRIFSRRVEVGSTSRLALLDTDVVSRDRLDREHLPAVPVGIEGAAQLRHDRAGRQQVKVDEIGIIVA